MHSTMKHNHIRKLLNDGASTVATRIESTWPTITEAAAATGNFDYLEFVAEYAPFSHADLENIARAAELHGVGTMIKVDRQNCAYVAQKALSSGFQAVLLCDMHSAAEVRAAIDPLRPDTPGNGSFGYPNRRLIGYQPYRPQMEYAKAMQETVIAVMVEKASAMDDIEAICKTPGVDMVQFGPSDYSMSMGANMRDQRQALYDIEARMIQVALKNGVAPRCEIYSPEETERYIKLGVRHFCIGDQMKILGEYWGGVGNAMRNIAKDL